MLHQARDGGWTCIPLWEGLRGVAMHIFVSAMEISTGTAPEETVSTYWVQRRDCLCACGDSLLLILCSLLNLPVWSNRSMPHPSLLQHVHSTIATTTRCQLMTMAPSCGRWRYVGWGVLRAEHMVALILFAGRAMLIRLRGVQRKYSRWATVRFLNSVTINYRTSHTDLPFHTSILFACQAWINELTGKARNCEHNKREINASVL